jgi:hypothetical protein
LRLWITGPCLPGNKSQKRSVRFRSGHAG